MRLLINFFKVKRILSSQKLQKHVVSFNGNKTLSTGDKSQNNTQKDDKSYKFICIAAIFGGFIGYSIHNKKKIYAKTKDINQAAGKAHNLPTYTAEEIRKHDNSKDRIWVTFKDGVYDVTDFVNEHPGGDQILLAAGNSLEPFWKTYAVHHRPHVLKILETLRIGNLDKSDVASYVDDTPDPYYNEPGRHQMLKAASIKPFNAETPESLLVKNFITPNELFYVRNHLPIPEIDPESYRLEIEVEGKSTSLFFTLDELKKLPKTDITATVMCAGNRRSDMHRFKPVKGLSWGAAAIGNAVWTGVRLRDMLKMAGVDEDSTQFKHIQFEALDMDVTGSAYGGSIPFWKGVDRRGDVLLAYEMNGVPIPRDHGFPIRVVVPGVVGARNVKWLERIIVSGKESDSHWQQNDYKGFSPSTDWDTVDYSRSPAIQELPVISAICQPTHGATVQVEDNFITVKGYAWSGGGQKIVRVDVTDNLGKFWHVANLDHQGSELPPQHWSWTLWSVKLPVEKGAKSVEIWVKAVDSMYNTQPESFEHIWNLRGVLNNAYHRITVNLKW